MAPTPLIEGSLFDFTLTTPDNKPWALSELKGSTKAVLLVNTASECGYTPQFGPLGELHNEYKDRGLVVVGVPSNDFGSQEPLASDKIPAFCATNYGATFPLSGKIHVAKGDIDPLYVWLGTYSKPTWNFAKYLFDGEGHLIGAYKSDKTPAQLKDEIEKLLA